MGTAKDVKEQSWWSHWKWVVIGTTLPVAIILLWWFVNQWVAAIMQPAGWAERGQMGDQFGAVNALFSGLALAGVVVAILMQREELALQREELRKSVTAQEESQKALQERNELERSFVRTTRTLTLVDRWRLELAPRIQVERCLGELQHFQRGHNQGAGTQWPYGPSSSHTSEHLREALRFFEQCRLLALHGHVDAGLFGIMLPEEVQRLLDEIIPLLQDAPGLIGSDKRWLRHAAAFLGTARKAADSVEALEASA